MVWEIDAKPLLHQARDLVLPFGEETVTAVGDDFVMKVGEDLAHFRGETGEFFVLSPRDPEDRGVKGAQTAAEIVLSPECPGFKG